MELGVSSNDIKNGEQTSQISMRGNEADNSPGDRFGNSRIAN